MDAWKRRGVNLAISAMLSDRARSVIPHYPQKTVTAKADSKDLERVSPEAVGVSSIRLYNMLSELEEDVRCNVHNLIVIKDGKVICECSAPGYGTECAHLAHSMSKSVVSMAAGLLFDDGILLPETRIAELFPEYKIAPAFADLRLYHLLTMTSGASFNEIGSLTEERWSEAFLSSAPTYRVGSRFFYNSMNSYMISAAVTRASGVSVTELLEERIFRPLSICDYFWELSPEGIEKGGWGLYLSAEAWGKLGITFSSGGEYFGKRILSEEWIDMSSSAQVQTGFFSGEYDYGFQTWVGRDSTDMLFNGMFGQNVWMSRKNGIVAVVQAGNNELFQDSPTLAVIKKYLGGDISDALSFSDTDILRRKEAEFCRRKAGAVTLKARKGILYDVGIMNAEPFDARWRRILGRYVLPKNNGGILPLITRIMQNSLDSSIDEMILKEEGGRLLMTVVSGEDVNEIEIGLYRHYEGILRFRGEVYLIRAAGEVETCADGTLTYRIDLVYPELPNSMTLRFKKTLPDRIAVEMREVPDHTAADTMIRRLTSGGAVERISRLSIGKYGTDRVRDRFSRSFAPIYVAADTSAPEWEKVILAEESVGRAERRFARAVEATVVKYIGDREGAEEKGKKKK